MDGNKTSVICEQGDMGLYGDFLSEEDQKKYDKENKETQSKE